jgi:hypothetical protein
MSERLMLKLFCAGMKASCTEVGQAGAGSPCSRARAATVQKMIKDHLPPDMRMSGDLTDYILK